MLKREIILTPGGYRKLVEELRFLVTKRRKEVAKRIRDAITFGDLNENSEYDDAKNEQAFIEGRIMQINEILSRARVIEDKHIKTDRVTLGSVVTLRDLESGEEVEYLMVGSIEADPDNHKISNESPVGRAIMGKKAGQVVKVHAPQGYIKYEIVNIRKAN